MNIYFVTGKLEGQGNYIPEDPVSVSSGGYRGDLHIRHFITAKNAELATDAFKTIYPYAKTVKCKKAGNAI